jgi:hypothetical protein
VDYDLHAFSMRRLVFYDLDSPTRQHEISDLSHADT